MSKERESAAWRHFRAIGRGKAESHRDAREEAEPMDPLERIVRGLALGLVWNELLPRDAEPEETVPLHKVLEAQRSKSRSSD